MKYQVSVHQLEHGHADIEVEAGSEQEAREKALGIAGHYEYKSCESEYDVIQVERIVEGEKQSEEERPKRRMVIFIEGGTIQDIFTDFPMDIHILDGDTQEGNKNNLVLIKDTGGNSNSYLHSIWEVPPEPRLTEHFASQLQKGQT